MHEEKVINENQKEHERIREKGREREREIESRRIFERTNSAN